MSQRQTLSRFVIIRFTIVSIAATVAVVTAFTVNANWSNEFLRVPAVQPDVNATFTVTNTNNSGPGSLRQAVLDANGSAGADNIAFGSLFDTAQTITLTSGEIAINGDLTISGVPGATLTIDGNDNSRIFSISQTSVVTMSRLTLTNGNAIGASGGAIFNGGNTTLNLLTVTNNSSDLDGGGIAVAPGASLTLSVGRVENNHANADNVGSDGGGGISVGSGGTLTALNSQILNNSVQGTFIPGGGVVAFGAAVTFGNSVVAGNTGARDGGGYLQSGGTTTVSNSTFADNACTHEGGAIWTNGTFTIDAASVTQNSAGTFGAGVYHAGSSPVIVRSTTIAGNTAGTAGGGLYFISGTNRVGNTIVGTNSAPSSPDVFGPILSENFNLFQSVAGATFTGDTSSNIIGQNPSLGPLSDNGGPTQTRELLPGSPAIDRGNSGTATTDQRGLPRPVDNPSIPNALGGNGSDIGAFEVQGSATPTPTNTPTATPTNTPTATPTVTPTASPTVTPTPGGGIEADVAPRPNGDGGVSSTDVVQLRRFATGLDVPDPATGEPGRADCAPRGANDGNINSGDVVQGRRYATGLDPLTNARPSRPELLPQRIASALDDLHEYFFGRELRIVAERLEADKLNVAVEMTPYGDEFAAGFTLEYDETMFGNPLVVLGEGAPDGSVLTVNSNEPGRIGILVDSTEAFLQTGVPTRLVTLTFEVGPETKSKARFTLTDSPATRGFSDANGNLLSMRSFDAALDLWVIESK